jgi:hypothetical protein
MGMVSRIFLIRLFVIHLGTSTTTRSSLDTGFILLFCSSRNHPRASLLRTHPALSLRYAPALSKLNKRTGVG